MSDDVYRNAGISFGLIVLVGIAALAVGIYMPGFIIGGLIGFAALLAIYGQLNALAAVLTIIAGALILSNMISLIQLLVQS